MASSEYLGFERGRLLLESMSSFWTNLFQDKDIVQGLQEGVSEEYGQVYFDLLEIVLSNSIADIPVFHREKWTLLTLKESNLNQNSGAFLKFGDGAVFGSQPETSEFPGGTQFVYGGLLPGVYSFALPEGLVDIQSYVMNRVHNPSTVLVKGYDFLVRNGALFLSENPFTSGDLPVRDIIDNTGTVVDREVALWALNSDFDYQFLWSNYGYLLDFFMESDEGYKTFINAVWTLFFQGPRVDRFISAVNGLLGLPVIREVTETIVAIYTESDRIRVVTDRHEYQLRPTATLSSSVILGAELDAFTPLADAIKIVDTKIIPRWWNNRDLIPIPQAILDEDFFGSMIIPQKFLTVGTALGTVYDSGISGKMTPARESFFRNFPRVLGDGWVLGETTTDIAILDLIMQNFFHNHTFLLEVDTSQVRTELLSSQFLKIINDALPAYVHFIGILDKPLEDIYNLEVEVLDPRDSPCRGVPADTNSGDVEPSGVVADQVFMQNLYDPYVDLAVGLATVLAGGRSMTVLGATLSDFAIGQTLRTSLNETARITGILRTGPMSATIFLTPDITPGVVTLQRILVDFEDVYTVTISTGGAPGAGAAFTVSTASGLETVAATPIAAFGTPIPIGSFNLEVRFEDAPFGAAADGVLVLGDSWTFNVRAEYFGGTQPGLVDPACIPAVNILPEEYEGESDYQDGYWGGWLLGDPVSLGDVDAHTGRVLALGEPYFIPGMRIYLRAGLCTPISSAPVATLPGP